MRLDQLVVSLLNVRKSFSIAYDLKWIVLRGNMQNSNKQSELYKAHRRQLLRMGAAGMPMVLTLRASAAEALISQLQCVFVIPKKTKILVDDEGRAWVGTKKLGADGNNPKTKDIGSFKDKADYVFPAGSVPEDYRPDACAPNPCADDWLAKMEPAEIDSMFAHLTDNEGDYLAAEGFSGRSDDDDDDDDDDDGSHCVTNSHGHSVETDSNGHIVEDDSSGYASCGYKVYEVSNKTVKPGDFVSGSGSWNLSGDTGLYIALSLQYADSHGDAGGWPGISCIVSILNYLNP